MPLFCPNLTGSPAATAITAPVLDADNERTQREHRDQDGKGEVCPKGAEHVGKSQTGINRKTDRASVSG